MTRAPDRQKVAFWNTILKPYWGPNTGASVRQLLTSAIPFVAFWYATMLSLEVGYWLTILLALPTAGFMMRLFMIQHDCGHGSFFRSHTARQWVGRCIGVLLLTPYDYWKRAHAYHHAHSGDLDFRGFGDIDTFTVREYLSWPWRRKLRYRLYRHPFVLFVLGPLFIFLMKHRYPWDAPAKWKRAWQSVFWTNLALVAAVLLLGEAIGYQRLLLTHAPVQIIVSTAGVWMFYVQHQFERTYWDRNEDWDYYDASLYGSSYLVLPAPLRWISANIGFHHVHHMSMRIPNYKLQQAHEENAEFHVVREVRFRDTLKLINLALWDEDRRRMVRFRDLKRLRAAYGSA